MNPLLEAASEVAAVCREGSLLELKETPADLERLHAILDHDRL